MIEKIKAMRLAPENLCKSVFSQNLLKFWSVYLIKDNIKTLNTF